MVLLEFFYAAYCSLSVKFKINYFINSRKKTRIYVSFFLFPEIMDIRNKKVVITHIYKI